VVGDSGMIRRTPWFRVGAIGVAATAVIAALIPLSGGAAAPALAPARPQLLPQLLRNTIPSVVESAVKLGAVAVSTPLTVIAPLTLSHQAALTSYIDAEYTPASPDYHHFLTPAAFADDYAAPTTQVGEVTHTLSSLGFDVAPVAVNRLYVKFSGTAGLIEQTFGTVIDRLRLPGDLSTFTSNVTDLTLPAALHGLVTGLIGLNSLDVPRDNLAYPTVAALARDHSSAVPSLPDVGVDGGITPCLAAIAGAGYTAPQLAEAYNFNGLYSQGYLGQGMTASLVEFDDYHDSNVATVQQCFGDEGTSVNRELVDGGTGGPPGAGETEDMLDIAMMLEMLPKLANLDVYVAPITGTAEYDLYNEFVTRDNSPVLSSSWGNCEELDSQSDAMLFNTVAQEAAAQGQQIFDAAGDSGAVDCRGYPAPTDGSISVETESASPYVTSVGGTDLAVTSVLGLGHAEDTWNDGGAGGGGQSTFWTMPSWQAALPSAVHAPGATGTACGAPAGTLCREVPDLSADADPDEGMQTDTKFQFTDNVGSPGLGMYCGTPNCELISELGLPLPVQPPSVPLPEGLGGWFPIGGTSAATPLVASAYVLWDQEAQAKGLSGLGFLNPALYAVAGNPADYANDFFDITTDSNDAQYDTSDCPAGCNPNHLYQAAPGYDMASGLGSINAGNLGADLVAQATQLEVTPDVASPYGYTKGNSTTTPVVISSGARGAPYTVSSSARWLHVEPGAIGGTLTWSASPTGLPPGTYNGTITISGGGSSGTLSVTYSVTPPAAIAVAPWTLHFSEGAVTSEGAATSATCGSTIWDDEVAGDVGGTTPTDQSDAPSKQTFTIDNDGAPGSILHWAAYFYSFTSGWLNQDLTPPGAKYQTAPTQPLVPTTGALTAGTKTTLPLVSLADGNTLGGYPDMNQGTYHGVVIVSDLADPEKALFVPAVLVLGNGSGTPTVQASPGSLSASLASGATGSDTLTLSDTSKTCGYAFSAGTNVPWATAAESAYSGTVGASGATASVPINFDASGLAPGTYHGDVLIQSQNAEPNPVSVPITLTVTPAAS
jgi:hypothetical protein